MSFTTLLIIFTAIVVGALISIILGIINWIQISQTSNSINELQTEIEKKGHEFDSIKNESSNASTVAQTQYADQQDYSENFETQIQPAIDQFMEKQPLAEQKSIPGLDIVRNIRSGFESDEKPHLKQETVTMKMPDHLMDANPESAQHTEKEEEAIPQLSKNHKHVTPEMITPVINPNTMEVSSIETGVVTRYDVLDVVEVQKTVSELMPEVKKQEKICIPLYSQTTKDADFNEFWELLTSVLENTNLLPIYIDFANILFLYDKEVEYLNQVYQSIDSQQRKLVFVNCSDELVNILAKMPALYNLIVKE